MQLVWANKQTQIMYVVTHNIIQIHNSVMWDW